MFLFYLIFELRLVPILLIILFNGRQPERLSAGAYFLLYTALLSVPYLVIVIFILPGLFFSLGFLLTRRSFISLLFMSPFLVKIPVFGLHY